MNDPFGFDSIELDWLRAKPGKKWQRTPGALAAWVADMDLPPAPVIVERLHAVVEAGDFGYPNWRGVGAGTPLRELFVDRAARRYSWEIGDVHELREFCDVMQAVLAVLHLCTEPGDGVILHTPAYPPFFEAIAATRCRPVELPRRVEPAPGGSRFTFDVDALEQRLRDEPARVLLLCNPHNPTGRVFTRDELVRLADLAERHDLLIVADEIHADLTYPPLAHVPIASLGPQVAARTVTLHSASKAFNLAGLRYAVAHVGAPWVRDRLAQVHSHMFGAMNLFAVEATTAAWSLGDEWLQAAVAHLDRNRRLLADLLGAHLPDVAYTPPEATYLAWLDCRLLALEGQGLGDDPSQHFRRHGIDLSAGPDFGGPGTGHVRLNMATSAAVLAAIVEAMAASLTG